MRRQPTMGAIYTALQRLEEKELVDSWLGEPTPQPGGRRKRHYRSTRKGIAVLVELRNARERLWQSIGPIPEVGLP